MLSNVTLNEQELSNACYGLYGLDGDDISTKQLVNALATKIEQSTLSKHGLTSQHVGISIYGLQALDGKMEGTKRLVAALAKKIEQSDVILDQQSIGNACFGLQRLDPNDAGTRLLSRLLVDKIHKSIKHNVIPPLLKNQHIGNIFVGIKRLLPEDRESIISALSIAPNLEYMKTLEGYCENPLDERLLYAQYIDYLLVVDHERGMNEFELLLNQGKIQGMIENNHIDCHQHVPSTAIALVSKYLIQDRNNKPSNDTYFRAIIVGQSKGEHWRPEHRRVRPAVEAWLKENSFEFTYQYGKLCVIF